jgi:hypothetical protein
MSDLNLTEEERQLVLGHRLQQVKRKARQERVVGLLRAAAEYREWLWANGEDNTLITFYGDFGHDRIEGEGTHHYVVELMNMADSFLAP